MTDKREAPKAPRGARQFPPTALEVPECPPHRWFIEGKWQECRKCGARMEVPQPAPAQPSRTVRKVAPVEAPVVEVEDIVPDAEVEGPADLEADVVEPDEVVADIDVTDESTNEG